MLEHTPKERLFGDSSHCTVAMSFAHHMLLKQWHKMRCGEVLLAAV